MMETFHVISVWWKQRHCSQTKTREKGRGRGRGRMTHPEVTHRINTSGLSRTSHFLAHRALSPLTHKSPSMSSTSIGRSTQTEASNHHVSSKFSQSSAYMGWDFWGAHVLTRYWIAIDSLVPRDKREHMQLATFDFLNPTTWKSVDVRASSQLYRNSLSQYRSTHRCTTQKFFDTGLFWGLPRVQRFGKTRKC